MDEDIVRRLHDQAQAAHQQREQQAADAVTAVRRWHEAGLGFLADIRSHLPSIVEANKDTLVALSLSKISRVGKGRKAKTVFGDEPSAGWLLYRSQRYVTRLDKTQDENNYLLIDGRIANGVISPYPVTTPGVSVVPDRMFPWTIQPSSEPSSPLGAITWLYSRAGLPVPPMPDPVDWSAVGRDSAAYRLAASLMEAASSESPA